MRLTFDTSSADQQRFTLFYGTLAHAKDDRLDELMRQCESFSKMLPCGMTMPYTDTPGRQVIQPGTVIVSDEELPFVADAVTKLSLLLLRVE